MFEGIREPERRSSVGLQKLVDLCFVSAYRFAGTGKLDVFVKHVFGFVQHEQVVFLRAQTGVGDSPGVKPRVPFGIHCNFIGAAVERLAEDSGELRFPGAGGAVDENVDAEPLLFDGGFKVGKYGSPHLLKVRKVVQRESRFGSFFEKCRLQILFADGGGENNRRDAGGFVELKPVVDLPCVRVTVRIGERQKASQRRIWFKKEAFGLFRRDAGGTGAERGNEFVAAGTIETIQYPVKKVIATARC